MSGLPSPFKSATSNLTSTQARAAVDDRAGRERAVAVAQVVGQAVLSRAIVGRYEQVELAVAVEIPEGRGDRILVVVEWPEAKAV